MHSVLLMLTLSHLWSLFKLTQFFFNMTSTLFGCILAKSYEIKDKGEKVRGG